MLVDFSLHLIPLSLWPLTLKLAFMTVKKRDRLEALLVTLLLVLGLLYQMPLIELNSLLKALELNLHLDPLDYLLVQGHWTKGRDTGGSSRDRMVGAAGTGW